MPPRKKSSRIRWLALPAGLVVFLALAAWVATTGWFLKSVVVPRIGTSLNSDLTVGEIRWSPWSELTLQQVQLTPKGSEPLASVGRIRVRYRLADFLKGRIAVQEITVEDPVVSVMPNDDGTSNLSQIGTSRRTPATSQAGKPAAFDVRNITLRNGVLRWRQSRAAGAPAAEISGLELALDVLAPETAGRLTLSSRMQLAAGGTNTLAAQTQGTFGFRLNESFLLRELNGAATATADAASGRWKDYGRLSAQLSADSTRSEVRELRLSLTNAGQPAGEIRLSGPFDPEKAEARIAYRVSGIGPAALGIAGALMGLDLEGTRLEADGRVDVLRRGDEVSWQGRLSADPLVVRQDGRVIPALAVLAEVRMRADLGNRSALIEKADLKIQQGGLPVVTGALNRPMNLAWGPDARGTRDAAYALKVSRLALVPWRSWFGPTLPEGTMGLDVTLGAEREGRQLKFEITGGAEGLQFAGNPPVAGGLKLTVDAAGSLEEFNQFRTDHCRASLNRGAEALITSTGIAQVNMARGESSVQLSADASLPGLLQTSPVDGVSLSGGSATVTLRLAIQNAQTNLSVQALLSGVSGSLQGAALRDAEARLDLSAGLQNQGLEISRMMVGLPRTDRVANELQLAGRLQWTTNRLVSGRLSATSAGLDLTPLAGMISGSKGSDASRKAPESPSASGGAPFRLPVGRFEWDSRLDAVYLKELAVSNWVAHADATADHVKLAPFQMTLNGAPVSAEVEVQLGGPAPLADFKLSAAGVPVRPLASALLPADLADLNGVLDAAVDLKGVSSLGTELRRALAGTAVVSATNLNYRITSLKSPLMRVLVRTLSASLRLPSISESPLRSMEVRAAAGQGVVTLESARVASDSFMASTRGEVRLADALTNSAIRFPVTVSLPKEGAWDELPTFLSFGGTLGDPKPDLDALGLARVLPRLPGAAGDLTVKGVEKLGGALDRALGGKPGTNSSPGAATGLLKNLLGVPPTATNAPKAAPKQP